MNRKSNKPEVRPATEGARSLPSAVSDPMPVDRANIFWPRRLMAGLLGWLGQRACSRRRLIVLERLSLAPRQTLWLVEAEGARLLIASSVSGGFTFLELDANIEASKLVGHVYETSDRPSLRVHNAHSGSGASGGRKKW